MTSQIQLYNNALNWLCNIQNRIRLTSVNYGAYRSYAGSALFSLNYSPSVQVHKWLFEV